MRWNKESFEVKLKELHPELTLISEFTILRSYVDVIDNLDIIYRVLAQNLLKSKPTIKSAINKNDAFCKRAESIHGNKYNYSKISYKNSNEKVTITCPIHGDFEQTPSLHLNAKHGCLNCKNTWALSKESWILFSKNKECIFYIINCYNDHENFIKFGITSTGVNQRFFRERDMPYKYESIFEYRNTGEIIWELEEIMQEKYFKSRYYPNISFGGKTECYDLDIIEDSIKFIKNKINEIICKI